MTFHLALSMYPSVVGEVASLRDRVKRIIHRPYLPPPVRPSRSVQTQTRTAFIPLIRGNEKPKIRKKKKREKISFLLLALVFAMETLRGLRVPPLLSGFGFSDL
ncbi:hypothetical protein OPV22_018037 [Ensete ventricosum]|uniref:Uncharacterized protein n=1 Tax=Ensete ventricosum TaxID=4639 RepID=A0AAV8QTF2_ENSVE|nr:hypothetical protein OPV22_018037 [Ensete ventricosum]